MAQGTKSSLYPRKGSLPWSKWALWPCCTGKRVANVTVLTRKAVAEVFRAFSPSESLSAFEARPAVKYLLRLRRRYRARMNNNCLIFKVIVKKGFRFSIILRRGNQ